MKNNILKLRNEKGLSQERLGKLMGTNGPQINRLEKGERRLTLEWIERAAKALEVTPEAIYSDAKAKESTLPPDDEVYTFILTYTMLQWADKYQHIPVETAIKIANNAYRQWAGDDEETIQTGVLSLFEYEAHAS